MEKQPQQQNTIQDSFLNSARKERSSVTIYLMSGVKLTGRIKSFDKYSVILRRRSLRTRLDACCESTSYLLLGCLLGSPTRLWR